MSIFHKTHKAMAEIDSFEKHRDVIRLIRAFQDIKELGSQAMREGDVTVCKEIAYLIETMHHHGPNDRVLNQQFLDFYLGEFKPTIFMVANMTSAPLRLHQQIVDTLIEHHKLSIDAQVISLAVKMASGGHFDPLAGLLDAVFTEMQQTTFDPEGDQCEAIVSLFHRCAIHIGWEQGRAKPLLQTLIKHARLMITLIEQCSSEAQVLWDEVINPGLLRAVQARGCPDLLETLFHEYAYTNDEPEVFAELLKAGMQLSTERICDYLSRTYDAMQGRYAYSAIYLHLCSGGKIPMLVDFTLFGGKPTGSFLNQCMRTWGAENPVITAQLAHTYLDHHPDDSGLYSKPLPRRLLEHSERLREDSLGSDLGL